jgi:hypothetical protein
MDEKGKYGVYFTTNSTGNEVLIEHEIIQSGSRI